MVHSFLYLVLISVSSFIHVESLKKNDCIQVDRNPRTLTSAIQKLGTSDDIQDNVDQRTRNKLGVLLNIAFWYPPRYQAKTGAENVFKILGAKIRQMPCDICYTNDIEISDDETVSASLCTTREDYCSSYTREKLEGLSTAGDIADLDIALQFVDVQVGNWSQMEFTLDPAQPDYVNSFRMITIATAAALTGAKPVSSSRSVSPAAAPMWSVVDALVALSRDFATALPCDVCERLAIEVPGTQSVSAQYCTNPASFCSDMAILEQRQGGITLSQRGRISVARADDSAAAVCGSGAARRRRRAVDQTILQRLTLQREALLRRWTEETAEVIKRIDREVTSWEREGQQIEDKAKNSAVQTFLDFPL